MSLGLKNDVRLKTDYSKRSRQRASRRRTSADREVASSQLLHPARLLKFMPGAHCSEQGTLSELAMKPNTSRVEIAQVRPGKPGLACKETLFQSSTWTLFSEFYLDFLFRVLFGPSCPEFYWEIVFRVLLRLCFLTWPRAESADLADLIECPRISAGLS